MLGLGTGIVKGGGRASNLGIITDNLVLKHDYNAGSVYQVSTGAASFTASNTDYIDFGDVCDLGTTDFSICFWAYVPEGTSQYFLSKVSGGDFWYIRTQGTDKIQFNSEMSSSTVMDITYSGDAVPENEWFHVAVTSDRSDGSNGMKIYLNGVVGTAGAGSATSINNSGNLYFGRESSTYLGGYMCNVGIWSGKALTQAEVKSIMWKNYADLTSGDKSSLVSWYNLDEETNTSGGAGTGGVKDHHGSNHGTLA